MRRIIRTIFFAKLVLPLFFPLQPVLAVWATKEDADIITKFSRISYDIEEDGRYTVQYEVKIKIAKENGRKKFAKYSLVYNGASEKVDIASIEAKIINGAKEITIEPKDIENKPIASSAKSFDQKYQISIPFADLKVGSEFFLKYKVEHFDVPLLNYFDSSGSFGKLGYVEKSIVEYRSKIPLYLRYNDPQDSLKIEKDGDEKSFNIKINQHKPLFCSITNEPSDAFINPKYCTWVKVSTLNKIEEFLKIASPDYTKVIAQPLPVKLQDIVEKARMQSNDIDKISSVMSLWADNFQYLGEWRTIKGRYFPRNLSVIAQSSSGDCKDFSVALAAMLKALGYKAQAALVLCSPIFVSYAPDFPCIGNFNHVIVKLTTAQGEEMWLDPTRSKIMPTGIFSDISDRPAYILDNIHPEVHQIPPVNYERAVSLEESIVTPGEDLAAMIRINRKLLGEFAIGPTGAFINKKQDEIEKQIFESCSKKHLPKEKKKSIKLPDLSSRCVQDVSIVLEYEDDDFFTRSHSQEWLGIRLNRYSILEKVMNITKDQAGDQFIEDPNTFEVRTIIKNVVPYQYDYRGFETTIDTPWLKVIRKISAPKPVESEAQSDIANHVNAIKEILFYDQRKPSANQRFVSEDHNNILQGIEMIERSILNKKIISSDLQALKSQNQIEILDVIKLTKSIISNEEIKSPEFEALKKEIEKKFRNLTLYFKV